MSHPWKHWRSGWTGLWATWASWSCSRLLQGVWTQWPLKLLSNPNYFMIVWVHDSMILSTSRMGFGFLVPKLCDLQDFQTSQVGLMWLNEIWEEKGILFCRSEICWWGENTDSAESPVKWKVPLTSRLSWVWQFRGKAALAVCALAAWWTRQLTSFQVTHMAGQCPTDFSGCSAWANSCTVDR